MTEIERHQHGATYTWRGGDLDELHEYVDGLYAVGAIGDEYVQCGEPLAVEVASDDLLPSPGQEPVRLRYSQWRSLHARLLGWQVACCLLAVAVVVLTTMLWWRW